MQEPGRIGLAFLMALALHVGALVAVALWQAQDSLSPPGEQEITIDFAPAMEEAVSVAPAQVQAVESPPVEVEPQPVETPTETLPVE